jgi:hypothetical protein
VGQISNVSCEFECLISVDKEEELGDVSGVYEFILAKPLMCLDRERSSSTYVICSTFPQCQKRRNEEGTSKRSSYIAALDCS